MKDIAVSVEMDFQLDDGDDDACMLTPCTYTECILSVFCPVYLQYT